MVKHLFKILFILFFSQAIKAQEISGQWNGLLKVQENVKLRLVFNISKTNDKYTSSLDSPDQGVKGIPVSSSTFKDSKLTLVISSIHAEYTGNFSNNEFSGIYKQGGKEFPLVLTRQKIKPKSLVRPQEPKKPYPYHSEDVTFKNETANLNLAGTLTLPHKKGVFPAVILISGSGESNRNQEIMGHKPFLVIADFLTKKGIAVLRYDDRGVGKSTGNHKIATTADFAIDALSAINYLKTRPEIDLKKIGLIGHSEGGIIAPITASKSNDVSFIILLAGTGVRGDKILLEQSRLISKTMGVSETDIQKIVQSNNTVFKMVIESKNSESLKKELSLFIKNELKKDNSQLQQSGMDEESFITMKINRIAYPWMEYFIKYDPAPILEKVKCNVLVLNGEKDIQVSANQNIPAITKALTAGGHNKFTVKRYPNLNHLFQECTTGAISEYSTIEQTFSPIVLTDINNWIKKITK